LYPALERLKQPKAGFHAFRRYRLTWLRKNRVHADLERFWMGHENETVGDGYSKMKEDVAFRLEQAEAAGLAIRGSFQRRTDGGQFCRGAVRGVCEGVGWNQD
jgi:hypothetical protein